MLSAISQEIGAQYGARFWGSVVRIRHSRVFVRVKIYITEPVAKSSRVLLKI